MRMTASSGGLGWGRVGTSEREDLGLQMSKRVMDVTIGAAMALLSLPIQLVVALAVRLIMGRPVLFSQVRPGLRVQPFTMYKFRTMRNTQGADGELLADHLRVTRLGMFLRRASLDELPELWSVLKGEMSLVGPRPLLVEYLDLYTPEQARRHDVKPGLTGLTQVSGRNALSWEDRLALDVWYVDNHSVWLDMKILGKTVWQVLARKGISAPGHATMPKFRGQV
jgi:lipopolysaccharide/colanic/teichoic acid biosynthesis glycosyltransferase